MSRETVATRRGLGRVRSLGREAFARASEEPYRRRPADGVVTGIALVVLVVAAIHDGEPTPFELDLARALTHLPSDIRGLFVILLRLGAVWAVGLVTVAALLARRRRLARDLVLAGLVAWMIARFLAFVVDGSDAAKAFSSVVKLDHAPRFPTVSLAVLSAVIFAAAPYLTRAVRGLGFTIVILATPGAIAVGHAFPNDVLGGLTTGVLVAAAIHVAFGSPGGRPTLPQIALALDELGVDATDLTLAPTQRLGRTAVLAVGDDGPIDVTVIGRDERDARYLAKAFRFLRYRDSGPALFHSRLQEVEHEAYVLLRAERSGVRVPEFVEVGVAGPDAAVLVTRTVEGRPLVELTGSDLTDDVLAGCWRQAAALHTAWLAHGHLDGHHLLLTDAGPVVTGFTAASSAAPEGRMMADVANLLAVTAAAVGPERAVAAARTGLGDDDLGAALPYLQPGVLTREVRAAVQNPKSAMSELRARASEQLGIEVPAIEELRRVTPASILTVAMTAFGVWALLGVIGNPAQLWEEIKQANFWFVLLGFGLWSLTNLTYAASALGGLPPAADVPLGPLTVTQSAGSFLNLATPGGVGTMLMNIRFLQKRGIPAPTAIASGTLPTLGYTIVQFVLLFLTSSIVADQISLSDLGVRDAGTSSGHDVGLVGVIVAVVAVVVGIVLAVPKIRAKVLPPVVTTVRNVWSVLTSPRKLMLIFGGSLATQTINVLILSVSLAAFGQHVPLAQLLFVNTAVSLFASVIPVPGGMGVVEAGLTAGLVSLGVDSSIATAAVMTDRLVTAYIPPVIGWVSLQWLRKRDFV